MDAEVVVPEERGSEKPHVFTSDTYAAEAWAADADPWTVFDSRKTPRAEFDSWLESNRPSQVSRYGDEEDGRSPVGWIAVQGPDYWHSEDNDVDGLEDSWDELLASGRPVNHQAVKELALNHRVLWGKWLMMLDTGFKVDHAWECVARATVEGKIKSCKVSPHDPGNSKHVICVYNENFTEENQVIRLEAAIRATGVKCSLSYKPDAYTYLGIYRNNRWKLRPTIYESKFDLKCVPRRSLIINRVTDLEVT